jgi:hypothetical protein
MAFTPSHREEFKASILSVALALGAYAVFRRGRAGAPTAAPSAAQLSRPR